jgi:hypothetical protein
MAKGRIRNRLELRAQAEAAERRQHEGDETEDEEQDEDGGPADEEESEEEAASDEEEEPEKKPPKKRKPAAKPSKPRSRAAKTVRMKVVWGVFNNSNQRVAVFDYPKRKEADEHAAKLATDKKSTFFVQPVKEPIEEKKEA